MTDFNDKREKMVERQVAGRGVSDRLVLDALRRVPRDAFVPENLREFAYEDCPLPIAAGQTISQPFIVGLMIEAAELRAGEHVLEIGTGSGYAAALLAEIAAQVDTVERHDALAQTARLTLHGLGYDNVNVHVGDGTLGWPQAAPFDAIIAAASGPGIPEALRGQLAIGGRLVMPVGDTPDSQRLVKLVRKSDGVFDEQDLGGVRFVPLVGEQGWADDDAGPVPPVSARRKRASPGSVPVSLAGMIREAAEPLPEFDSPAFGALFDRYAGKRVILLGESTHGTSEFYRARAAITRRLVEAHGYTIVAVEADWPDAAAVDRHVRGRLSSGNAEPPFRRFPTWMWRNTDVVAFTEWLRGHNAGLPVERRTGFYGLDMYSLSASVTAVLDYLDRIDPEAARIARERYGCLTPWQKDPAVYGRAMLGRLNAECEDAVVAQLQDLLGKRLDYSEEGGERFFDAAQNARLVAAAERYYRAMYYGSAQSWNLRDTHMFETLEHLLDAQGPQAKAVVWAHNSHIGNAAATEMGRVRDELNIGQLCRERFGNAAALIGFGTHTGTVAAATDWDGPMEIKRVCPSREDSYEGQMHGAGLPKFLLDLRSGAHDALRERLRTPMLERFIGVIYRPGTELQSHYAEACLAEQFDAFVWLDETHAVTPLETTVRAGEPETYPFGL